jgi:hypothetical protein
MSPDSLDPLLRKAKVPAQTDDYWNRFPDRVVTRLRHAETPAAIPYGRLCVLLFGAAAFGLIIGFALWHRGAGARDEAGLRDGRVLRELAAQYSNRLQAVVLDGSGLHAQLSAAADVSPSDPIWLEIRDGRDRRVIVTFSGQRIRCGDRNVIVLSDVGGQVMLVGDGFFWSQQVSAGAADKFQIRAEQLLKKPKTGVSL